MILKDVAVTIEGRRIIDGANLSLGEGKISMVIGPNGAGKSTLLKVMAADIEAAQGHCSLANKPLATYSAQEQAHFRAVMVQQCDVSFPFTVSQIVAMGWLGDRNSPHLPSLLNQALRSASTLHLKEQSYMALSGGEKQRVQFARAWLQLQLMDSAKPRFLLLDEPSASLDLYHQHHLLGCCQDLASQGVGVLVVIHDLNLAALYAEHLWMVVNGQIRYSGTVDRVLTPSIISEVYGVDAIVNKHPILTGKKNIITY